MTVVRRPGRLQRIAVDLTPLNAPAPDLDARIGWLLAMSRLHHPDPSMADGGAFLAAVGEAGRPVSRSLVSRWEAGTVPVSYDGTVAYETALGLNPHAITSLVAYTRSLAPGVPPRVARPPLHPSASAFADRLDDLVERAEDGQASAVEWLDLSWHLAASPHVHLRARTWEALARDLVWRLPRGIGAAYRGYAAAAVNLAGVPRAQGFLTDVVEEYVASPGVEVITNPLGLLAHLSPRRAARLTLDLLEHPPTAIAFQVAVWAATQRVRTEGFTPEETARLDMLILGRWRANQVAAGAQLAELVASLPEGLRATFTAASARAGDIRLQQAVETGEDVAPALARTVSQTLADLARARMPQQAAYSEDMMLARLVREAIFHRDTARRHVAALFLATSPFAGALCDETLTLLAGGGYPALLRARAATLVRYLADDTHRLRVLRFLEDQSDEVAAYLTQTLGHLTRTDLADQAVRASLRDDPTLRERAKVYALGMSGSCALASIARSAAAPAWQREAAQWWIDQGPALRT